MFKISQRYHLNTTNNITNILRHTLSARRTYPTALGEQDTQVLPYAYVGIGGHGTDKLLHSGVRTVLVQLSKLYVELQLEYEDRGTGGVSAMTMYKAIWKCKELLRSEPHLQTALSRRIWNDPRGVNSPGSAEGICRVM